MVLIWKNHIDAFFDSTSNGCCQLHLLADSRVFEAWLFLPVFCKSCLIDLSTRCDFKGGRPEISGVSMSFLRICLSFFIQVLRKGADIK
jgi:hypothetical protein